MFVGTAIAASAHTLGQDAWDWFWMSVILVCIARILASWSKKWPIDPRKIFMILDISPRVFTTQQLNGQIHPWSHLVLVAVCSRVIQWLSYFKGAYFTLLGVKAFSLMVQYFEVYALVDSFFCMITKATDVTVVGVLYHLCFKGALLVPVQALLGWEEAKCITGTTLPSWVSLSTSSIVVGYFVLLLFTSSVANRRLRRWEKLMLPRRPFLFADMKQKLDEFNQQPLYEKGD
jgi:hypothetical protein